MDIFDLRDEIVLHDYADYAGSFISISDSRIKEEVDTKFASGLLWPEPLLQLNPSFASGGSVDDLVQKKILAPQCSEIFRIGKTETDPAGRPMQLYRHQTDAILAAQKKKITFSPREQDPARASPTSSPSWIMSSKTVQVREFRPS